MASLSLGILTLMLLVLLVPIASASPLDDPLPPTALRAEGREGGVHLVWEPPLDASAVTAYRVYRFNDTQRELLGETGAETTEFFDVGVSSDYIYTYYTTAVSEDQESLPSNTASAEYPHCFNIISLEPPFANMRCLFPVQGIGDAKRLLVLQ